MPASKSRKGPVLFTYLLKTLAQALRNEAEEGLRDVGLTLPQLGALRTLKTRPEASKDELARVAFVSPEGTGELLEALEQGRLITRIPDPRNARGLRTSLTTEGSRVLARGLEELARAESLLVSDLSTEEQRQLRRLLERCVAAFAKPRGAAVRPRSP